MRGIESSARIGKIIGVIEVIAFQTKLDAVVEAVRAGEVGKGLAIVMCNGVEL